MAGRVLIGGGAARNRERRQLQGLGSDLGEILLVFVPKGLKDSARGFNPGYRSEKIRPEGVEGDPFGAALTVVFINGQREKPFCRPFGAGL